MDWDVEPTSVSPMADFNDADVVASTKVISESGVIDVGSGDEALFDEASVDDLLNSLAVGTDERRHDGADLRGVIAGPSLRPRQPVPAPPRRAAPPARPAKRPTVPPPGPLRRELRAASDTDVRSSSAPAARASSAPAARAPSIPDDADTQLVEAPDFGRVEEDELDPIAPPPVAAQVAPERSARHESHPPQPHQVPFTPVLPYPMPEQFTGPVPYATAPGASVPYASGAYPVMATGPVAVAVESRSKVPLIMCLVGAVGIGIGVGAILFARGGTAAVPAAAPATAQQPVQAPAAPAQAAATTAPTAPPAEAVSQAPAAAAEPAAAAAAVVEDSPAAVEPEAPQALTLEVASVEHGAGEPLHAPVRGVVSRVFLTEPRLVKKNEKLFEITRRLPPSPKAAALAKRVKELEALAKTDPEYKAFVERARRDHKRAAQVRTEKVVVRAARAGMVTAVAKRGAQVGPKDVLATVADPSSWIARASLTGEERPTSEWSCRIVPADAAAESEQGAPCRVLEVAEADGAAQVVAAVEASAAPWLTGAGEQRVRLVVEPRPVSP